MSSLVFLAEFGRVRLALNKQAERSRIGDLHIHGRRRRGFVSPRRISSLGLRGWSCLEMAIFRPAAFGCFRALELNF